MLMIFNISIILNKVRKITTYLSLKKELRKNQAFVNYLFSPSVASAASGAWD
jgi:hypothetical protein